MLTDNGSPWGEPGRAPLTPLGVFSCDQGVRIAHSRPYHPQTQGKDERFHRTLKAEALGWSRFRDLADCRGARRWRHVYNHERPHEALDLATPAQRYQPSSRPFRDALPTIDYAPGDQVRKVSSDGFINFKNQAVGASARRFPRRVHRPSPDRPGWRLQRPLLRSPHRQPRPTLDRGARPVDLWTTLKRVVHRVHRTNNSNRNPALRDEEMCQRRLRTPVNLVSGPNTAPQGGRE